MRKFVFKSALKSLLATGEVANVKYRTLDKRFRQVKGADKILYGLDDAVGQDTIIIVEGKPCHLLCRHLFRKLGSWCSVGVTNAQC